MRLVSPNQMKNLDRAATEDYGIPSLILMENAGRGIADILAEEDKKSRFVILIGKGNNGGDGMVIARHLVNKGFSVTLVILTDPEKLKGDAAINYNIVAKMHLPIVIVVNEKKIEELRQILKSSDVIVDAIFGIGLSKAIEGFYKTVIGEVNLHKKKVYSVDIPSGLDGAVGDICGVSIKANKTFTLGAIKKGLLEKSGPEYSGEIKIIDISIPANLLNDF